MTKCRGVAWENGKRLPRVSRNGKSKQLPFPKRVAWGGVVGRRGSDVVMSVD